MQETGTPSTPLTDLEVHLRCIVFVVGVSKPPSVLVVPFHLISI
ncbi:MAG TPA: hypothetical protein VK140_13330 [Ktedonobacteraceae bacterium]|nr:hypothetical protein [Ktedonobacteraceae bacterium]